MIKSSSCRTRYAARSPSHPGGADGAVHQHRILACSLRKLEEANDLLRAESDTAARLRKSHTEMAKSMSQLEGLNRELQERSRAAEGEKGQLEKELLHVQSSLDSERRNYSQGSEEIRELQGDKRRSKPTSWKFCHLLENVFARVKHY